MYEPIEDNPIVEDKPTPNFFLVNRQLLDSGIWLQEPFTRGQAWIDLIGLAQHSDSYIRVRGIKVDVKRGQLAWSQLSLSKRWQWSRDKVRRYLVELEKDENIRQQNNKVTTLITIVKYNLYQGDKTTNDTTNRQQKNIRKTSNDTHTKNVIMEKKERTVAAAKIFQGDLVGQWDKGYKHALKNYKQLENEYPHVQNVKECVYKWALWYQEGSRNIGRTPAEQMRRVRRWLDKEKADIHSPPERSSPSQTKYKTFIPKKKL